MSHPQLSHEEVVRHVLRGTLPESFVTLVTDRSLHPLFEPGSALLVERKPIAVGDLVALLSGKRVAFRRVLAARGPQLLVRADIAPWPDGWIREPLGRVSDAGLLATLAQRAPHLWTHTGWALRRALLRLRTARYDAGALTREAVSWWRPRGASTPSHETFAVRPLRIEDGPAAARFLRGTPRRESLDVSHGALVHPHVRSSRGLGLAHGNSLVGAYWFAIENDAAFCHDLFVDPSFRGRGGAQLLVRAVLAEAARGGAVRAVAHVAIHNTASLRSHMRGGFRRTERWAYSADDPLASAERQLLVLEADMRRSETTLEHVPLTLHRDEWIGGIRPPT